jgi:hypothetical protein
MELSKEHMRSILKNLGAPAELISNDDFLSSIADTQNKKFGSPVFPSPGETLAFSVMKPKTAALAFDRVYRIPVLQNPVPKEIGFFCGTMPELILYGGALLAYAMEKSDVPFEKRTIFQKNDSKESGNNEKRSIRFVCSEFQKRFGITPTIIYSSPSSRDEEFKSGKFEILTTSISNVAMVDEEQLTWEQILEFRKDAETRAKYCRFVRWVDLELKTKSSKEVEDLIAVRLDDYQWSLKKHGLKASVGTLSCLLDPKFLAGTSAAVAATSVTGGSVWGALAGASLVFGRAAVNFGTAKIDGLDERRKENYEVAYVHEIQKQLGKEK